ncbi:type IV toxin-antitoxin system AbiEi family antitoxin domain-containing protein [Haematomicrobium sanguinis]|uniref:type IV toxin-antitoxin system AbiEi family antitoxin domain-containing protein n=1 Tax=Haematomicrobium sanguinis TaxID=479106 RepID=UPI00047C463B|nr:type IV toxin-antitoxin system AbiEi family antitoxin domain-containing protein [Haematomicrobium sanguinis]
MTPELKELLRLHEGVLRAVELERAGIPRRVVDGLVELGKLKRHPRGVVARPGAHPQWVTARARGADLGCISLASVHKLWVMDAPRIPHIVQRHSRTLGPYVTHRHRPGGQLLNAVLDAFLCVPPMQSIMIADAAVSTKQISLTELKEEAGRARSPVVRGLVARVQPACGSYLESAARYILEDAGYHVQVQRYVEGLGRIDLLVNGVLGIELDGRAFHHTEIGFLEDRRRNNLYVIKGVPTLRITFQMVFSNPQEFLDLVGLALAELMPR